MSDPTSENRFELWLSWLLRGGTYLALAFIAAGLVRNLLTGTSWIESADLALLLSGSKNLRAPPPARLEDVTFIQAAIALLIALPALRVAFLLVNFLRRKELLFALISATVLGTLILGYFLRLSE